MHHSERTLNQRPSSQEQVDAHASQSWEIKPVANIELIPQVDEEDEFSRQNSGTLLLRRDNSVKSLRRDGSKQSIKEKMNFGLNPSKQNVAYIVSHQPVESSNRSPVNSKNQTAKKIEKLKGSKIKRNHVKKQIPNHYSAEIVKLKAHIMPNKQTMLVINSNRKTSMR